MAQRKLARDKKSRRKPGSFAWITALKNPWDFRAALRLIFSDPEWFKKLMVGTLLSLTGVGAIAVTGWGNEITRRELRGQNKLLPNWKSTYFGTGFRLLVADILWELPYLFLVAVIWIPAWQLSLRTQEYVDPYFLIDIPFLKQVVFVIGFLVSVSGLIVRGRFAQYSSIPKSLNWIRIFQTLSRNFWAFILAGLWFYVISYPEVLAGSMANKCLYFLILSALNPITTVLGGHLVGQVYRPSKN